jgi:septal ring factor EnvC (AmiA/AmiB activator)
MRRGLAPAIALAVISSGFVTAAVRGERNLGYGIGVDVEIARVLDEIETESAKQTRLEAELKAIDSRRHELQAALKTRVRALYRITRSGMTPVGGGFDAIRQHVARVRRLSLLVASDAHALHAADAQIEATRNQSKLSASSLGHARERLRALQRQEAAAPSVSALVQRQQPSPGAASGGAFYGLRLSDAQPSRSNFEAQRGKLAAPVTGEVRVVDARRGETDGPGLEFQAPAGTSVRAAASGRVAFADRYGSYGRLVIIDHGDGYYTAYGGLAGFEVRVGDEVSTYARLGTIGDDGGRSGLFFEVRKGTRALPPRAWLGL